MEIESQTEKLTSKYLPMMVPYQDVYVTVLTLTKSDQRDLRKEAFILSYRYNEGAVHHGRKVLTGTGRS